MRLEDLTDEELQRAAAGEAQQVLEQRRREQQDRQRRQREQQERARRRQDARDAVRTLDDETLQQVADDPRTAGTAAQERRLWAALPHWGAATKGDLVEAARDVLAERRRQRERAHQLEGDSGGATRILGRPIPLWLAAGLVYLWRAE